MLSGKRKVKLIAMIVMVNLLSQVILPVLSTEVFATEEVAEETETTEANQEITRNYEIKEEETWDVSANNDGSVMAKWTRSDRTIVISGTGEMKDWARYSKEDWHNTQYTNLVNKVVIKEGVTEIGEDAFYKCASLIDVMIPEGVTSIGDYVFKGCTSLASITIPSSVKSIGDYVFEECSSLTSITIPEGVTSIESYAFNECTSLENIVIPEGVTSIEYRVFYGCSSIASITIPSSVTSIESCAFESCSNLENIIVDENNKNYMDENGVLFSKDKKSILKYPEGKKDVTEYTIPEGVTSIESYAFYKCSSLSSITIPKGVTSIESYTFNKCTSLESITIPKGVTSIGEYAFYKCSSLSSITIPSSVISIGTEAFQICSSLKSITIPEGVTNIGEDAIGKSTVIYTKADSEGHRYAEENEQGYVLEGNASNLTTNYEIREGETWDVSENNDGSVIAKWTINDRTIVISGTGKMKCWLFGSKEDWHNNQYTNAVEKVIIEEGITYIGMIAFYECSSLESVIIPNGVTRIGEYAFLKCSSLSSITIPSSVTSIGTEAFYGCSSLKSITIPEGVTDIGGAIFSGCSSLTSITISSTVTSISGSEFSGCSNLENIIVNENNKNYMDENGILFSKDKKEIVKYPQGKRTSIKYSIPEGVTSIGDYVFEECSSLTSITIPEGVTSIGDRAFYECSSLTSITIPEGVTSIGDRAFYECSSLSSITIPSSVTSIGIWAFCSCSSLESIIIPEGVTKIEVYAFFKCTSLESIIIPNSVTSIGDTAFYGCSSLTSIIIPEGVTSIGSSTFYGCTSLTSITIPEEVTSIGNNAIDKTTFIYAKANTEAHRYAEENQQGYILDDIAPNITYTPNDGSKAQKKYEIKIDVVDNGVGLNESSLKYEWTQSATGPAKEKLSQTFNNGDIIKKSDGDGKWYLWVYAKDNLENQVITSKEFNFDNTAPNILSVTGNPTEMTNQNVTVTITSDEQLQKVEGWNLSEDKQALTKEYSENATETVKIKDLAGNESNAQVKITNIDKIAPTCKVTYSTTQSTKENVTVTITSNEKLQEVQGWTLSQDKLKLTKQYSENKEETLTVKDLVGNESKVSIKVANIVKESEILKGDINKDGQVNTVDMIKMLRHIAVTKNQETEEKNPTWKLTGETFTIADINEDGQVNTTDLLKILRHISASKDDEIKEKHPDWILN